jgi:ribosomal protein L7/L12
MKITIEITERLSVTVAELEFAAYTLQTIAIAEGFTRWDPNIVDVQNIKIAAIKILRAMPDGRFGLADAKHIIDFAIENWDEVRNLSRVSRQYII